MKKRNNNGYVLIEVLFSVAIFSVGVLGILAYQLKSVEQVREAEYRGVISIFTESLAEGMRMNPTLSGTDVSGVVVIERSWSHYGANGTAIAEASETENCTENVVNASDAEVTLATQDLLAKQQTCAYSHNLSDQLPKNTKFRAIICTNEPIEADSTSDVVTSPDGLACKSVADPNAKATVIKVGWTTKDKNKTEDDTAINHSYQLFVGTNK